MNAPKRVQMTRQRPWRAENPDAVIVARPSKWGNPFKPAFVDAQWIAQDENGVKYPGYGPRAPWGGWPTREGAIRECVRLFDETECEYQLGRFTHADVHAELAGRDLACWCPLDSPCHADVLLELANGAQP